MNKFYVVDKDHYLIKRFDSQIEASTCAALIRHKAKGPSDSKMHVSVQLSFKRRPDVS